MSSGSKPLVPTLQGALSELQSVYEFAEVIGSISDIDELFWVMADSVASIMGLDDCVLYLRDGENLVQKSAFGVKADGTQISNPITILLGEGVVGTCAETGQAQHVDDVTLFPGYIPDQFSGASEMAVPVKFENHVIGVFDSEASAKNAFSARDVQFFARLSCIAAPRIYAAIQHGKLEDAVRFLLDERTNSSHLDKQSEGRVPLPGQLIGGFRLDRLLFLGEAYTVWEAFEDKLSRPVVLEVQTRGKRFSETTIDFVERAQVASQLDHNGIAEVYDCGKDDGWTWLSQEHTPYPQILGDFLNTLAHLPRLPEDYYRSVAGIFKKATSALGYAHSCGILHGNLSPNSMILTTGHHPHLIGFGRKNDGGSQKSFEADVIDLVRSLYFALTFRNASAEKYRSPSIFHHECPQNLETLCNEVLGEKCPATIELIEKRLSQWEKRPSGAAKGSSPKSWFKKKQK